ncbi:STM3941 family protein [Spirulina sp. 06S082]|uniref:STM3941 family protein n=1 Tax=Spirulina sp. 06S082 TaxID=3110248 RepID=UPI002B1F8887|nr:STM3941 family protein [Spirulina sp. 06S082]MEA5468789.1 STM3941 family protein [Spirulina sp. 06S082]
MDFVKKKQENLTIYANRKRIAIAFLIVSLSLVFSFWLVVVSLANKEPRFLDYVVGSLLACYFGYLTFHYSLYLLKYQNKSVLTIDDKGIWDNTFFSKIGAIAWEDIEEIFIYDLQLKSGGKERSLGIIPKTGQVFLKKFPLSWQIRRVAIAAFFRFPVSQTPINILLRDLNLSRHPEFEREMQTRIQNLTGKVRE